MFCSTAIALSNSNPHYESRSGKLPKALTGYLFPLGPSFLALNLELFFRIILGLEFIKNDFIFD